MWRSAARYDPTIAAEVTFVSVIARRELIDGLRQTLRRRRTLSVVERYAGTVLAQDPLVERREEAQRALRSISRLGTREQLVISLSIDRGLSHRCIARVTGLPVGTVKTHARRGLLKLRGMLTSQQAESDLLSGRGHRADPRMAAGGLGGLCRSESCSVTSAAESE
jgi:RNA polymerase sigma-70 factor (ECF subfamily)